MHDVILEDGRSKAHAVRAVQAQDFFCSTSRAKENAARSEKRTRNTWVGCLYGDMLNRPRRATGIQSMLRAKGQ